MMKSPSILRPPIASLVLLSVLLVLLAGCDSDQPPVATDPASPDPTPVAAAPATTPPAAVPVGDLVGNDLASAPPAAASKGPLPVVVEPATLDIGIVPPGQAVTGEVTIRNTGDEPLTIVRSSVTCTCTRIDLSDVTIDPGNHIVVPATFTSSQRLGTKNAVIQLVFDGYDEEVLEIPVTAEIALAVKVDPNPIRHQLGPASFQDQAAYEVSSIDGAPFRILAVQGKPPVYLDFNPERDQPRSSYRLLWDFSSFDPTTCVDANGFGMPRYLAIETDHPSCPVLDARIRHVCTGVIPPKRGQGWVLSDERALIGGVSPGETVEFDVAFKWLMNAAIDDEIVDVESVSLQFTTELVGHRYEGEQMFYTIRVTVSPDHRGLIYGYANVKANKNFVPILIIGKAMEPAAEGP